MSYTVKKGDSGYDVFEKDTETLIRLGYSEKEARTICRKMNLGSGFNGWTPTFFTEKMKVPEEEA